MKLSIFVFAFIFSVISAAPAVPFIVASSVEDVSENNLEQFREETSLMILANLTTALLKNVDQLAHISGKKWTDVVKIPETQDQSSAELTQDQKRAETVHDQNKVEAIYWKEFVKTVNKFTLLTITGLDDVLESDTKKKISEIASTITAILSYYLQ